MNELLVRLNIFEANTEYVAAGCCAQVLWIKSQLADYDVLYDKETVRAGLETLRLVDEKDTSISSTNLVNSSLLRTRYLSPTLRVLMVYIVKCLGGMQGSHDQLNINQQTITYSLCWGLDIDIGNILFSNLVVKLTTGKKGREPNICYTRYLSFIIEHLMGNNFKNDKFKTFKPHQISATSFKKPFASEVPLTSHMLKVAKLSPVPGESLIPPSGGVNADDTADKSLSGTSGSSPITQVANTQYAEEPVATADATKSVDASKSAEELENQPKPADAKKRTGDHYLHYKVTFSTNHLMHIHETIFKEAVKDLEITSLESEIKLTRKECPNQKTHSDQINLIEFEDRFTNMVVDTTLVDSPFLDEEMKEADSNLESISEYEIMFMSDNDEDINDFEGLSKDDEVEADHVIDELVNMENTKDETLNVFATSTLPISNVSASSSSPRNIQALIAKAIWEKAKLPNQLNTTAGDIPKIFSDAITAPLPDLLSTSLKELLPHVLKDSVKQVLPKFDKRVKKTLKTEVPNLIRCYPK
ncbi:hypothetical protein Tco_0565298 [Tanacetum coccineum]